MESKVIFKKTARLAVTAGLAASMTLGSFPLAVFADAAEPEQKPAVEQETPKAEEGAVEEQVPAVEETQPTPAAEEAVSTAANSAADAEAEVNELQQAVNNASNGQLTLSKDYSFESPTIITVGSNLAITGANHKLHNVVFKVVSASFEVKNAVFSGKSRVWDSSATSIKVSRCTMNVDLGTIDGVAAGWGLHAFVCGTNEANGTHKLNVVIEDNTLTSTNSDGGFGLFYDWASLTGTGNSISRNTIGSTDEPLKLDNGFDPKNEVGAAITIMNGDNGAQVKIDGNNIFASTDRRAVVVYQNCSRQNTYTATFSGNELRNTVAAAAFAKVFANADKAGMGNGNKAHLRAVFLDNNTINGETVSFDNVDVTDATGNTTAGQYGLIATGVKLDQSGKMTAGIVKLGTTTVADFNNDIAAADNKLPAKPNADGTYKVEAKYVAQVGTNKYETLNAAIKAANGATDVDSVTIELLADTKMDATASISKKIVLNGNGHQLNGQLAFRAESDGSKVQNVHFVFDKDTKFNSGDWASNIRIEKASNIEIIGNQFKMTNNAAKHAGKSIAVHVFPIGASVSGTKIANNTFDIEYNSGNFGIFVSNEINGTNNTLSNTLVDNNTFVAHEDAAVESYFLVAFDKNSRQGVKNLTVSNNHIAENGDVTAGILLGIWGGVDGAKVYNNIFGAGATGISIKQDSRWNANTLPSKNIDIKGNAFYTATAVADSGVIGTNASGSNGLENDGLKFAEYTGADANTFGANTVPFKNLSSAVNSYGAMFYDADGVTLLDWQVVKAGEAPQDKKAGEKPGYASTWYTDAEGQNAYDFKSDASKDGLLKLYLKRTAIEYKVTYDLDGGVNAKENPATFTVESGEIKLAAPTRDGYDFAGWVDKDGKKVEGIAASTVGDIALKATWTKKAEPVVNHTVTFVDGLGNKTTQTVSGGDKAVAPVDPEHDGWEFLGWYTSEDFKELYDFNTPVTGDLTLYGGWRKAGSDEVTEPEEETKPEAQKPGETKPADKNALPKTGDDSALPMAIAAGAGVAAIAAGAVASKRRKQE